MRTGFCLNNTRIAGYHCDACHVLFTASYPLVNVCGPRSCFANQEILTYTITKTGAVQVLRCAASGNVKSRKLYTIYFPNMTMSLIKRRLSTSLFITWHLFNTL